MIRMNPAHDTKTPAGTWKNPAMGNPVLQQEKPLTKEIDAYKSTEEYKKGYIDGWNQAWDAKIPQQSSEFLR